MFKAELKVIKNAARFVADDRLKGESLYPAFVTLYNEYQKLFKAFRRMIRMSDKQQHGLISELEQAFESFIRTLVTSIDAKHRLTAGHSTRVTEYVLFLGQKLSLGPEELEVLKYAALLHDIGKIGIPDAVLNKCGRFTLEERAVMNEHSAWTHRILSDIRLPRHLRDIPRMASCHHEKMDGTGYPYGLSGEGIPFFARIIAVGDVFDALTSRRDYPKYDRGKEFGLDAMSMDMAFGILEKDRHTHFDPGVVDVAMAHRLELERLWQQLHTPKPGDAA
ncbi:MAG: HD-GYP domain-containing protein [Desulfamplus sp.]|nr:HD-GYP domain-containing protein [Desulfamplus sp.]